MYNYRAQVIGWPPIRSYRKNNFAPKKAEAEYGNYVKVSMDGAPYLRKIDLKVYTGYKDLLQALENMFKLSIGINNINLFLTIYVHIFMLIRLYDMFLNVSWYDLVLGVYSEREGYKGSEHAPTYEDKDGDWMLVGDVPWE